MKEYILGSIRLLTERETWNIIFLSLKISLMASILAFIFSILFSISIVGNEVKRKNFLYLSQSFLFIPSVAIGLVLYMVFSKRGFLGFLDLLYTPKLMIIGQCFLVFPLISVFLINGLEEVDKKIKEVVLTLGANLFQYKFTVLREGKFYLISAFIVGFSRAIGETGLAMVVGGNIKGETRVITTAIALYTMRGEFEIALSLALILFIMAILFNFSLRYAEKKWRYM